MSSMTRLRAASAIAIVVMSCGLTTSAQAAAPKVTFRVFAHPAGHNMDSIVWTGKQFLYVENTANTVWAAPASGSPVTHFASMPDLVEETRCILSPGSHGFAAGAIFCHSPDNKIYEISADGSSVTVFASLPAPDSSVADGALTWDDIGHFGFKLLAATGRSGAPTPAGGTVYAVDATGAVQKIGSYPGPGGADEIMMAPATFGTAGGKALLTVDPGAGGGALLAIDQAGRVSTVAKFKDGPNPEVVVPTKAAKPAPAATPGLYVTDDISGNIYFAPASDFARFAGDVVVGTELGAQFWVVSASGRRFALTRLRHNLRGGKYGLEGAIFIG